MTYPRDMIPTNISLLSMCFWCQHSRASAQIRTSLTNLVSWLAFLLRHQIPGSNPEADLKVPILQLTLSLVRLTLPESKVQGPNPFVDPKVPFLAGSNPGADLNVPVIRLTLPPVQLTSPQRKVQGPNPFADPKIPYLSCGAL